MYSICSGLRFFFAKKDNSIVHFFIFPNLKSYKTTVLSFSQIISAIQCDCKETLKSFCYFAMQNFAHSNRVNFKSKNYCVTSVLPLFIVKQNKFHYVFKSFDFCRLLFLFIINPYTFNLIHTLKNINNYNIYLLI